MVTKNNGDPNSISDKSHLGRKTLKPPLMDSQNLRFQG